MHKETFLAVAFFATTACADTLTITQRLENNKKFLQSHGIELLDGEVKIVSAASFMQDKSLSKDANIKLANNVKSYLAMHDEFLNNGYVNKPNDRCSELLELANTKNFQLKSNKKIHSDMCDNINEMRMAYTFLGVPPADIDANIGFVPYGAYKYQKNGFEQDGWDGVAQFFEKTNLGVCEFKEHNLKIAHGGIYLIQELTTYEINDKPTVVIVQGNENTGYTYKVSWYDNTFDRSLECANKKFANSLKEQVIELAKRIDSRQE